MVLGGFRSFCVLATTTKTGTANLKRRDKGQ